VQVASLGGAAVKLAPVGFHVLPELSDVDKAVLATCRTKF
jgi:hypothetical protein